jgi:hypothetical protein
MNYGLIFWGNSSYTCKIFRVQRKVIRTSMGHRTRDSCHNLFKELKILPSKSQYIFSLLLFVVNSKDEFVVNSENYNMNTRQGTNRYLPQANLAIYQKGVCCLDIKIFNSLSPDIKNFSYNPNNFKTALKTFLHTKSFYSLDNTLRKKVHTYSYNEFCIRVLWFGLLFVKCVSLCTVSYLYISSHTFNILSYLI